MRLHIDSLMCLCHSPDVTIKHLQYRTEAEHVGLTEVSKKRYLFETLNVYIQ